MIDHILHWLGITIHPHLLLYTGLLLLLLYRPPKVFSYFTGMSDFLSRHFGDSIGFYFVHLGILLQILAGAYAQLAHIDHVGESLLVMGVGILKLKYIPKDNGNGVTPVVPAPLIPAAPQAPAGHNTGSPP